MKINRKLILKSKKTMNYPYDKDLENLVIGTIISNTFGYDEIREIVNEDCFYSDLNRKIFRIFKELEASGEAPDYTLIAREYHKKYSEIKVDEIMEICRYSSMTSLYSHACRLNDLSARRKLVDLGLCLQSKGTSEKDEITGILSYASKSLENIYSFSDNNISTIKDAISSVYKTIDSNRSPTEMLTGSPTGFSRIDNKSGGLQASDLIIIAGDTSQGKTSFAMSILNNTVKYGTRVAVYSLEMKKEQLAARLMAMESGVPASKILYAPMDDWQFEKLDKSINGLCDSTILFDDRSTSNIDTIINSIRLMVLKYKINGAIIDYLQILNVNMKGSNKEQQMADVARRLKNLAKGLDIWIIALSQLNRDNQNPVPSLHRLRDSGQIAEAADLVMFVYRPEIYQKSFPEPYCDYQTEGYALIDIAKGRNVGLLKMLCRFDKETTHFIDVSECDIPNALSTVTKKNNPIPF
jgi:replicative DNA helicase